MAFSGQTATQAPHPVQRAGFTSALWTFLPSSSISTICKAPSCRQPSTQLPVPEHKSKSTSATNGSSSTKPRARREEAFTAALEAPLHASPMSMGDWQVPASSTPATDNSTGRSFGWTSWRKRSAPTGSFIIAARSDTLLGSVPTASTTRSTGTSTSSPKVRESFTLMERG